MMAELKNYNSFKDDEQTLTTIAFKSFDQVLKAISPFNKFHVKFIIIFQIATIIYCGNYVFMAYATLEPEIKCVTADEIIFEMNHSDSQSFCEVYEAGKCIELQWKTPFKTIIEEWKLICDLDYVPQMINSIQSSGEFIALAVTGPLSDAFGRKTMLLAEFPLLLIAVLCSAFSTDWKLFALFRFFVGGLIISNTTTYTIWAMELTDERHNVIMNLASSWQFSYIVTALIAYFSYQWRTYLVMLTLIGIVPLFFIVVFFVESPRWQIQKGKLNKASKGISTITSSEVSAQQLSNIPCETHAEAKLLCFSLFSSKNLAIYTVVLCIGVFATATAVNAYIFQVTQFSGSPFIKFILYGGFRLIIPVTLYIFDQYVDSFGRRHMFLIPMGLVCLLYSLLAIRDTYFPDFIRHLTFYYMLSSAVIVNYLWIALAQYTVELYPTVMRNTAHTFTELVHPLSGILVPQLVYLERYWPCLLIYVVIIITLLSFITAFVVLPETKGNDLPEMIESVPKPWSKCFEERKVKEDE